MKIILEEKLYESFHAKEITALRNLEHEMCMQGDSRSEILRDALDVLYIECLMKGDYVPNKLKFEWDTGS